MNKYHAVARFARRGLSALALSLVATAAYAVDPTYTSQISGALTAVDVTDIITDITAFFGVLFGLVLISVGYHFVSNRLKGGVR